MTHTFKSKKALFLAVFLAFSFTFTPNLVRAQASEPATSAQVDALQQTLITLLTQLIAQLQAQITELLAQQSAQATQLGAVQTQVNQVVENTAPVVGVSVPEPEPVVVSINPIECVGVNGMAGQNGVKVSLNISGGEWSTWKIIYDGFSEMSGGNGGPAQIQTSQPRVTRYISPNKQGGLYGFVWNVPATYHMTAHVYDSKGNEVGTSQETELVANCPASPNVQAI